MESLPDRLPLVIGVTGHRDLRDQDVAQLEEQVAAVIAGLRRHYLGHDPETPIIVLSALAEGADRLVARVALAQGAHLIAPLPMPLEEYRRDFDPGLKPGNAVEFDQLLARAVAAPVMPFMTGNSLEAVRAGRKKRALQYRAVGLFIVQHCHVLLALSDGDERDMAAGGTAEVVTYKRDGIPLMIAGSVRASLDASEVGPVVHIVTPRAKEGNTVDHVSVEPWGNDIVKRFRGGALRRSWRHLSAIVGRALRREHHDERAGLSAEQRRALDTWESFEVLIGLTREFNTEAAALARSPDGPARVAQSVDYLFSDPEGGGVNSEARAHALSVAPRWCALYAIADVLAQKRQRQFVWDWKLLFAVGLFAFTCFAIFSHAGYVRNPILAAYSISFGVIAALFARARIGQHQERFLDYRALAEMLRVAVYWKLVGIGARDVDAKAPPAGEQAAFDANPVEAMADAYPIVQSSELAWVKISLRTVERLDKAAVVPRRVLDPVGHDIARRYWVASQLAYFRRQGFRYNVLGETIETYAFLIVSISPLLLVPLLIWDVVPHAFHLHEGVHIVIGLLPGFAAALAGYAERLAFSAQARQYDRMRMLYARAYELLPEVVDERTAPLVRELYAELGREAMKENAEWVAIYRQRPIQPQAG